MARKDKDNLKMLLRQVELPSPPADFTKQVMQETSMLDEGASLDAHLTDVHLKAVLQEMKLPQPPASFTYNVQKGIRDLTTAEQSKPVISKGVWIGVFAFLIVCVVMAIYPSRDIPADGPIYFSWLADRLTKLTTSFREPILYFEVIILSSASLLGLERLLRKGFHWGNT